MQVIDLDEDGHLDLVAVSTNNNRLRVFRGSMAFTLILDEFHQGTPVSLAIGEVTSDHRLDILVGNGNTVSIYAQLPDGGFSLLPTATSRPRPSSPCGWRTSTATASIST